MKIIAGLGNPGKEYAQTRHNIGFMAVQRLVDDLDFPPFHPEQKFDALISSGIVENEKTLFVMPQTFMNKSGNSISGILNYYKLNPEELIVICDDLDTDFGKIRIRKKGGPGTHNGLKSINSQIGDDYIRVKLGIENNESQNPLRDTASFVLSRFNRSEWAEIDHFLSVASSAVRTIIIDGIDTAMNKYN